MYLKYKPNYLMIPKYISKYANFSSLFILLESFILYNFSKYLSSFLKFCLYISTLLNWFEVRYNSFIKKIDIAIVILSNLSIGYDSFLLNCFHIWLYGSVIVIFVFMINKFIFYYQVEIYKNNTIEYFIEPNYSYFSLQYTNPYTISREKAYFRLAFTHIIFLHIIPSIISICILLFN
jgi:hypothetical protein